MAVDRKAYTETVDTGLKANKEFTKFYLNCKINNKIKQKVFDYTNKSWDKVTRKNKAKADAIAFRDSFKVDTDIDENIKMSDFVTQYFSTMEKSSSYSGDKWKGEIESYYKRYIKNVFGNKKLCDVRQLHIKEVILNVKNLGLSPRTQKTTLEILNPIFKSAIANRIIIFNPCDGVSVARPKTKKKVRGASAQIKDIYNAIITTFQDEPYFKALYFFALQGRRKSEILTLRWENIDFDNNTYTLPITKNGEEQTFILPDLVKTQLVMIKSNRKNYVFESPTNSVKYIQNIQAQTYKLKKILNNPDFGIHYLRNVVVSAMAEQGVNATFLSGALGHSDLTTMKKYVSIPYQEGSKVANQTIEQIVK